MANVNRLIERGGNLFYGPRKGLFDVYVCCNRMSYSIHSELNMRTEMEAYIANPIYYFTRSYMLQKSLRSTKFSPEFNPEFIRLTNVQ